MRRLLFFFLLPVAVLCASCGGGRQPAAADHGDTLRLKYARYLTMVKHRGYTVATLSDPWHAGKVLHQYVVDTAPTASKGQAAPSTSDLKALYPNATIVRAPIRRSIVFTAAHCQLFYDLHAQQAIKGVCDLSYIHIPDIQKRAGVASGTPGPNGVRTGAETASPSITDCGNGMAPMVEKIIALKADALLLSPFENSGGYGKLEDIGIPIIECADYMETSALGRAEWMKFYGLLLGCEARADSLFRVVEKSYLTLKAKAARLPKGCSVLTERKTGAVWYCPGGHSTLGQLIADANARYAFSSDTHSGSLPLSFEQVLSEAGGTDVWMFKYDGNKPMTKSDLLAEFHGYTGLKAFRTGNIYECNSAFKPYFEEVPFHPDYLLRELIIILHPESHGFGTLRYYRKLD